MSSHESTPDNPDIPYKELVERIDKEESRLRLAERYTNRTSSTTINQVSHIYSTNPNCHAVEAIKHTINQLHIMDKQDLIKYQDHMCMAMNIIRDRHLNDRKNFKGRPQFLKFCRSCGRHGHSVS